jgi:hypothetical protein
MTDITVTLGPRPDLDPEEKRQRALRAAEVLDGAGWVFDEVISSLTRELLDTQPAETDKREGLFRQIDGAAQVKGRLKQITDNYVAEMQQHERKHRADPPADHE